MSKWTPSEWFWKGRGLPEPLLEYKFHPKRKWKFDYAWPDFKIALEIEGGIFMFGGSRHNRGAGMRTDMSKYNEAARMGWRVFKFLPEQLKTDRMAKIPKSYEGKIKVETTTEFLQSVLRTNV